MTNYDKTTYYIATGARSKMFTLWRYTPTLSPHVKPESYITNLSTNWGEAVKKAKARLPEGAILDEAEGLEVGKIQRERSCTPSQINFGKHKGTEIAEMATTYLAWLWKGASIKMTEDEISQSGGRYNYRDEGDIYKQIFDVDDKRKALIEAELITRKELTTYKGKLYDAYGLKWAKKKANDDAKLNGGLGFHGTLGDKIELKVKIIKSFDFQTDFGTCYFEYYKEVGTGKIYIYKGGRPQRFTKQTTIKCKIQKHENYKGQDQTFIAYIKPAKT